MQNTLKINLQEVIRLIEKKINEERIEKDQLYQNDNNMDDDKILASRIKLLSDGLQKLKSCIKNNETLPDNLLDLWATNYNTQNEIGECLDKERSQATDLKGEFVRKLSEEGKSGHQYNKC